MVKCSQIWATGCGGRVCIPQSLDSPCATFSEWVSCSAGPGASGGLGGRDFPSPAQTRSRDAHPEPLSLVLEVY